MPRILRRTMKSLRYVAFLAALMLTNTAWADDDIVRLRGEPTSYTNVIDAFDSDDSFDLNLHLGFQRSIVLGSIQREDPRADGRGTANVTDIADYEQIRNVLLLGADIGVWKDLALFLEIPLILSDARTLALPDNRDAAAVAGDLQAASPGGPQPLFSVPFTAPTRFGVDHINLGAAYEVWNQYRDWNYPTWLWRVEGQIGVGEPMHACFDDKPVSASSKCYGGSEPGVGEGLNGIKIETRASRRFRYIEPYLGFAFLYRWAGKSSSLYKSGGDLDGYVHTLPPQIGTLTAGVAVIPWEQPARSQRLTLDFRFVGDYLTKGHGYSPLTDALGTSQHPGLRTPVAECPTCSNEVAFVGLTDQDAHARLGGQVAVEMQAAQYVRFVLSANVAYATTYALTSASACNSDVSISAGDPRQGTCRAGISDPHQRAVIDLPGNRFFMHGQVSIDLLASAVAQF